MIIIAGIGSRQTPTPVLRVFESFAKMASPKVWFRSGHADGADYAFEKGAKEKCLVYLPWKGFNSECPLLGQASSLDRLDAEAFRIVLQHEPYAADVSRAIQLLKCRNVFQILGQDLKTLSDLVICWTPNGETVGGTGLALKIARDHYIPVINVGAFEDISEQALCDFVKKEYPHIWGVITNETI